MSTAGKQLILPSLPPPRVCRQPLLCPERPRRHRGRPSLSAQHLTQKHKSCNFIVKFRPTKSIRVPFFSSQLAGLNEESLFVVQRLLSPQFGQKLMRKCRNEEIFSFYTTKMTK